MPKVSLRCYEGFADVKMAVKEMLSLIMQDTDGFG